MRFGAPRLIEPKFDETQKDERHYPSDALIFKWRSVGGLGGDECYLLGLRFEPEQTAEFLVQCGDQTQTDYPVSFQLNRPFDPPPNYGSLLPGSGGGQIWVYWTITVIKRVDGKNVPLSPPSQAQFWLKGYEMSLASDRQQQRQAWLAERLRDNLLFLSSALALYRAAEGFSEDELAEHLRLTSHLSGTQLTELAPYETPCLSDPAYPLHLAEVARAVGVDADALHALLRRVEEIRQAQRQVGV